MSFFNLFKRKKQKKIQENEETLLFEGINALFLFLDEVLPNYEDKEFHTVTPQIYLILYVIGMSKSWCKISSLPHRSQTAISLAVTEGIFYRYKIELRDWTAFIVKFYDPEKINIFLEHEFIKQGIKQGEDHFFYFLTLKYIPHNPLDILLKKWMKIKFYNDNEPYEKGEIDGYFSKEEYSFISRIMMFELLDIDENYESSYQEVFHILKYCPFDRSKYYIGI